MGKRLTASEETALLADTVRQAHEVIQELKAVNRESRALVTSLITSLDATHQREIQQLSNHMTEESNRAAAQLNAEVAAAREEILRQLTVSEIEIDQTAGTMRLIFPRRSFQEDQPLPYPHRTSKETRP